MENELVVDHNAESNHDERHRPVDRNVDQVIERILPNSKAKAAECDGKPNNIEGKRSSESVVILGRKLVVDSVTRGLIEQELAEKQHHDDRSEVRHGDEDLMPRDKECIHRVTFPSSCGGKPTQRLTRGHFKTQSSRHTPCAVTRNPARSRQADGTAERACYVLKPPLTSVATMGHSVCGVRGLERNGVTRHDRLRHERERVTPVRSW